MIKPIFIIHKKLYVGAFLLLFFNFSIAQSSLTIEQCYLLAKENYPLVSQLSLLEKTKEYSLDNAQKAYLPQVNLNGQATYQSAVTKLPIALPNMTIPSVSKDQYKLYGEVYQPLTEFKAINSQKEMIAANTEVEKQKIEVELYKLKDRINQLYFGILLMNEQIAQTELLKKDIQVGIEKTTAAIQNGTATKMNADLLLAEILKANQRITELDANKKAYSDMLSVFIKQKINDSVLLQMPILAENEDFINRPELKLFDLQKKTFDIQSQQLNNKVIPKVGVFLQAGLGRPALNMLNNDFTGYYIGGLRFNWNISNYYTLKNDKAILLNNQRNLDFQKETFLLNTNITSNQQSNEITKYKNLLQSDNELIELRERIKKTANIQLSNGIISPLDFLNYLNAEDQAKQNLILHKIQMLFAQYNLQTTIGN